MQRLVVALQTEWQALLAPLTVEQTAAQKAFDQLVTAYSEAGRYYHTLTHIQHVLATLADLRALAVNWPAVYLAAWFHDVIYDSHAADNEERSAALADITLAELVVAPEIIAATSRMILNTKTHHAEPDDFDSLVLLDADLAILGAPARQYDEYSRAIRQEYAWIAEADYRAGRKAVLQRFLQRDRLYFTAQIYNALQERARQNLLREIETL